MKQQERQKKSKEKILQAAITEFSTSGYDKVTMENICTRHGISKGMMYHYYSGKDDLFLLCVQNMYQMMQQYLEENMAELEKKDALHALKEFWMLRESFFGEHPPFKNIFENALLRTPKHLQEEISRLHQPLFEMNQTFLKGIVLKMQLRGGLRNDQVLQYIECVGTLLPSMLRLYQMPGGLSDLHAMLATSEEILDMLLSGVIRQEGAI